jgi:hypothetical protein
MRILPQFQIPHGVVELSSEYEKNLVHYELIQLKPRGTILFAGEKNELKFQFIVTDNRADGIFAKLDEPYSQAARRLFDYLSKYPRTEAYITITLLQFRLMFVASRTQFVATSGSSPGPKTLLFHFPEKLMKMHRRKFIRIPFNEQFPAELTFDGPDGTPIVRRLKDLSREGLRLKIEPADAQFLTPGLRLKNATLKLINREMTIGIQVVNVYPGNQCGCKIFVLSEEDRVWLCDFIRVLIRQILNLEETAEVDDQLEKDE